MISNLRASGQNTSKETQDNTHLHLLLFPGIRKDAGKGNPLPDRRAFCCFEVPFNWTTCTEVLLLWAPKRTRGPEMRGSALPFWSGNAFIHRAFIQTHTFACNVRDPWTTLTYPERCGKFMDLSWLKNFEFEREMVCYPREVFVLWVEWEMVGREVRGVSVCHPRGRKPTLQTYAWHWFSRWLRTRHFPLLGLSFLICQMIGLGGRKVPGWPETLHRSLWNGTADWLGFFKTSDLGSSSFHPPLPKLSFHPTKYSMMEALSLKKLRASKRLVSGWPDALLQPCRVTVHFPVWLSRTLWDLSRVDPHPCPSPAFLLWLLL